MAEAEINEKHKTFNERGVSLERKFAACRNAQQKEGISSVYKMKKKKEQEKPSFDPKGINFLGIEHSKLLILAYLARFGKSASKEMYGYFSNFGILRFPEGVLLIKLYRLKELGMVAIEKTGGTFHYELTSQAWEFYKSLADSYINFRHVFEHCLSDLHVLPAEGRINETGQPE